MNKICVFVHYSKTKYIPYNVQLYTNELSNYFDEVRIVTNRRKIHKKPFLKKNIAIQFEKNEGYDFGMFYKFFKSVNIDKYSQIAIINDSNLLINKLCAIIGWGNNSDCDFWGVIDSHEKPWFSSNTNNYHIQSHFLILNKNAIELLPKYFDSVDIEGILKETDIEKLRRSVIDKWEIGFSQFLIAMGLKSASYIDSKAFLLRHNSTKKNIAHKHYRDLLEEGYPQIKKKILHKKTWRKLIKSKEVWEKSIRLHAYKGWDVEKLINDVPL